ncbi:glycoside hydrolase family 97 catalytic domain-containing protein [Pelagicoccus sp. SDUM812003]|uniref:glycoside hydrolase family 97 protein n=1 Tax=Pelagicoccus sp. SDUM812003 TaxID=3041267 RepID=UPI0028109626|nr:glycoside hydrolase family 97 catalytic domain-containing protein [Pelagicoccus sp. SDUM812003]MDQ8203473.1 glycoside hydrolase family 97 catalytic domain-containing protein [Pelagicoccus sp. SDUM812003]
MTLKAIFSRSALCSLSLLFFVTAHAQANRVISPNEKIEATLLSDASGEASSWYLEIAYMQDGERTIAIPRVDLGLVREDQSFVERLTLKAAGEPQFIEESYTAIHGKRSECSNVANERTFTLENADGSPMELVVRAYDDGVTFRYSFPEDDGEYVVLEERTAYTIDAEAKRWLQKWNPANEGLYLEQSATEQQEWCYPALFQTSEEGPWFLLHESDVLRSYCGTKLSNLEDASRYDLVFPNPGDARGVGESQPTIELPWKSPWRVIILGELGDLVESTLIDDVATPNALADTDWIEPGAASWNYWSDNHGTKDFQVVCDFADLAASMGWPYTLLDWEWDAMGNGGDLYDAVEYIKSIGVKPLIWYNSGGDHTWVPATPKDRMLTHENRVEEFTKLNEMGIVGVKVDFFESEKQHMIDYYLDIVEDAAAFEMLVYFHGCLVPRGWARTYPNLMTYEGVRGAEWYNNTPELTTTAPQHNATLPFTRNVIGAMDYTPTTFTNSQHPHLTSYGHELALSVVFESAIQHFADRPEGYYELPDAPRSFLKRVPVAWDDTKFIAGYPGKDAIIARRKGEEWYVGGINGEWEPKSISLPFDFLPEGESYRLTLIADGKHDKAFATTYHVVTSESELDLDLLRRGGFAAVLEPNR